MSTKTAAPQTEGTKTPAKESHQDKITRTRLSDARLQRVRQIRALVACAQKTDPNQHPDLIIRVDFDGMLISLNPFETQRLIDTKLATLITEHRADTGSPALPAELDAVIEMVAPLEHDSVDDSGPKKPSTKPKTKFKPEPVTKKTTP